MSNDRTKATQGEVVELTVTFYGFDGAPTQSIPSPKISIVSSDGSVILSQTSAGITNPSTGVYKYFYDVPKTAERGLWKDLWTSNIDGVELENEFNFLVVSESAAIPDGSIKLGDDVSFDFSQEELEGINVLLKQLKCRLRSDGRKPKRDRYGAFIYDAYGELVTEECNVFSDEILACFLVQSLSEFNSTPFFTSYQFSDQIIYKTFANVIIEGAYVVALASQALVERGRDFTISDGGISYQPPQLGDFLQSHYQNWLTTYRERLKFIKASIRPGPATFGTYSNLSSGSPAFARLRHIRQRKIV
jgi:hypothetical protein